MECTNKLKVNEYVSINQLKKKIKSYLCDKGYSEFKPSVFAQGLVVTLVMVLEEIISDCIKNVTKDKTGLYIINNLVLKNLLNESDKYNFTNKFIRKYNSVVKYHDAVFFNIKKVMDNLETKHGSKLMIDSESKNLICYLLLSLQYDIVDLTIKVVKYSNRKTLNNNILEVISSFMLSEEISSKIKLRLDSYNVSNENDEDKKEDASEDYASEEDDENEEDIENIEISANKIQTENEVQVQTENEVQVENKVQVEKEVQVEKKVQVEKEVQVENKVKSKRSSK